METKHKNTISQLAEASLILEIARRRAKKTVKYISGQRPIVKVSE